MGQSKTYDPLNEVVTFGALLGGYAEGTFIEVERDEDEWSVKAGSAGDSCWVRNRNRNGKATLTVMQDSQTNDYLSGIYQQDALLGTGVLPFTMDEVGGTTNVHAAQARIAKPPKVTRGKEHNNVEWTFLLIDVDVFNGGLT